ncbi:MAG: hypothetical protein JWQ30_1885 [Sediminibacterium sp.]|nr:hypothetical protein [Sediminibacterium sp.]
MEEVLQKKEEVSVVIATLGGPWLQNTIDSLTGGSKTPSEILICIPVDHAHKVAALASSIVRIVPTEVKGQVKQRAFGFTQAKCNMVLQLDDDTPLEKDSLRDMVKHLTALGPGNAVGPIYYGPNTRRCNHELENGFVKNIFDCIVCAAPWGRKKMGVVTSIGLNYGVDDSYCTTDLLEVSWLPGACALSFRDELITDDYFPFTGKAYCEDLFHSYYRRIKGIRSWIVTNTRVYTDEPVSRLDKEIVNKEIEIRRYYVKLVNGPRWRLFIYEVFCRARSFFYSLTKKPS